jgi:hypothetical protein
MGMMGAKIDNTDLQTQMRQNKKRKNRKAYNSFAFLSILSSFVHIVPFLVRFVNFCLDCPQQSPFHILESKRPRKKRKKADSIIASVQRAFKHWLRLLRWSEVEVLDAS